MSRAGRALGCSSRTLDREAWMGRGSSDLWGHGGGRLAALAGAGQPGVLEPRARAQMAKVRGTGGPRCRVGRVVTTGGDKRLQGEMVV